MSMLTEHGLNRLIATPPCRLLGCRIIKPLAAIVVTSTASNSRIVRSTPYAQHALLFVPQPLTMAFFFISTSNYYIYTNVSALTTTRRQKPGKINFNPSSRHVWGRTSPIAPPKERKNSLHFSPQCLGTIPRACLDEPAVDPATFFLAPLHHGCLVNCQ